MGFHGAVTLTITAVHEQHLSRTFPTGGVAGAGWPIPRPRCWCPHGTRQEDSKKQHITTAHQPRGGKMVTGMDAPTGAAEAALSYGVEMTVCTPNAPNKPACIRTHLSSRSYATAGVRLTRLCLVLRLLPLLPLPPRLPLQHMPLPLQVRIAALELLPICSHASRTPPPLAVSITRK